MGGKVKLLSVFIAFPVCMHCYLKVVTKDVINNKTLFYKNKYLDGQNVDNEILHLVMCNQPSNVRKNTVKQKYR